MENRNKALAKNTVILGFGQLIPKLLTLITLPILTKHLSTESFGIYDLILSVASLALPFLTLLIQQAAFRFLIDPSRDKGKVITNTFIVIGYLFALWLLVPVIATIFCLHSAPFVWMAFVLYSFESCYDSTGQIIRGLGNNLQYSNGVIIYSVFNMVLLLLLSLVDSISIVSAIVVSALGYLIGFLYLCHVGNLYSYVSLSFYSKSYIKEMMFYSLPIIPSAVALWIVNLSDRLIIIEFLGSSINGIYSVANKIPNLCGSAYSIFNLAWTENASRSANDFDRNSYYSHLFNALFSFLVGMVMLLMVLSPLIFSVLIDSQFADGMKQMPPLFLGVLFSCMVSFLGGIYVGLKRTKVVGVSSALGAIFNLLINILFIEKIGLFAASISTVLSFFLIFIYRVYDLKYHINLDCDKRLFITSFCGLSIVTMLFYFNLQYLYSFGTMLCIIYNYLFNKEIMSNVIRKIKTKLITI